MNEHLRILLVDDDEVDRLGVQRVVRASGLMAEVVESIVALATEAAEAGAR